MKNAIKTIRKEKGFTQKQLAEKVGISRFSISKIENERTNPSIPTAVLIAYHLGVSLNDIFHEGKR